MSTQPSPPFARRQLGRLLRDLRKRARISSEEACRRLEMSTSRLSRIETGQAAPDIHVARSMLDLYEIPGNEWEWILDQVRDAKKKGWWQAHGLAALGYVGLESFARSLRSFSLAYVPGLLQTEDYMRAIFRTGPHRRTVDEHLENDVTVRLRRQERLIDPDQPLELTAIIDEGVLRRPIGGVEVMRAQLRHIVEQAALPNVTVQVMPTAAGAHHGMTGSFTLLSFPSPDDADIAYLEHSMGGLRVEKPEEVHRASLVFDQLRSAALSPDESMRLIKRIAAEL